MRRANNFTVALVMLRHYLVASGPSPHILVITEVGSGGVLPPAAT